MIYLHATTNVVIIVAIVGGTIILFVIVIQCRSCCHRWKCGQQYAPMEEERAQEEEMEQGGSLHLSIIREDANISIMYYSASPQNQSTTTPATTTTSVSTTLATSTTLAPPPEADSSSVAATTLAISSTPIKKKVDEGELLELSDISSFRDEDEVNFNPRHKK